MNVPPAKTRRGARVSPLPSLFVQNFLTGSESRIIMRTAFLLEKPYGMERLDNK